MDANISTMTMSKTMPVQNLLRYISFNNVVCRPPKSKSNRTIIIGVHKHGTTVMILKLKNHNVHPNLSYLMPTFVRLFTRGDPREAESSQIFLHS